MRTLLRTLAVLFLLIPAFTPFVLGETAMTLGTIVPDAQGALDYQIDEQNDEFWAFEEVEIDEDQVDKGEWLIKPVVRDEKLTMVTGNSHVIRFGRLVKRIAVSDPAIADVVILGTHEILINTKKRGAANLIVWDVTNEIFNYHLTVTGDSSGLETALNSISGDAQLEVFATKNGFVVKGEVDTVQEQRKIEQAARAFSEESVSLVSLDNAKQILLEIRFLELNRGDDFNFGIDGHYIGEHVGMAFLGGATGASLAGDFVSTSQLSVPSSPFSFGALDGSSVSSLLSGGFKDQNHNINYFVKALESQTNAKIIARPNLLVRDGEEASFLVGGEFPVPVITDNTQNIQYREFGTRLTYQPEILDDDIIRLTVDTEVSQLDFANGVTLNNFLVPALTSRRTSTIVELETGYSLVVGGLMQTTKSDVESGTPILRHIPLLGKLFQSTQTTYSETELIVIITPRLIDNEHDRFVANQLSENDPRRLAMQHDMPPFKSERDAAIYSVIDGFIKSAEPVEKSQKTDYAASLANTQVQQELVTQQMEPTVILKEPVMLADAKVIDTPQQGEQKTEDFFARFKRELDEFDAQFNETREGTVA